MPRKILITGGLGTLGLAQVIRFAEMGDALFILEHPKLQNASVNDLPGNVKVVFHDLADLQGAQAQVADLAKSAGGIDVLVNNAALIINRPFESFSLAEFEDQMRVNSSAAFALAQAVAPGMKAQESGSIINFCSVTLNGRWNGYVPYVTSKGAMLGLTKSLARELGPFGVRVNAVSPGAVVSEAEQRVFGDKLVEYNDWVLENQSLKTRIQPQDVAGLIAFLCSDDARMITGQNFAVDGGW